MKTIRIKVSSLLLVSLSLLTILACKKEKRMEVNPEIRNLTLSTDTLPQGVGGHFLKINFTYLNQFGESGPNSSLDSLTIVITDLRFPPLITHDVNVYPGDGFVDGENGEHEFKFYTTCCVYTPNTFLPCSISPGEFQTVLFKFEYLNNLGFEIPPDTIHLVLDCSY